MKPLFLPIFKNLFFLSLKISSGVILLNIKVVEKQNEKNKEIEVKKIDEKYIGKKMSRNEPCFCGSGKKYKKCCGAL